MKKHTPATLGLLLAAALIVAVLLPARVQGGSLPSSGWWSSLYIQNAGSKSTTITSAAYRVAGATPYVSAYRAFRPEVNPVATGDAILLRSHDFKGWAAATPGTFVTAMPPDFVGGLSALAQEPTRYLVELTNRLDSPYGISGGLAAGQYEGAQSADDSYALYFPMVKRDYYDRTSTLFVQYLGTYAAGVYVEFYCANSSSPPSQYLYAASDVAPGTVLAISPADDSVIDPDFPDGRMCSAVASNNDAQPMVGLYTEYFTTQNTPSLLLSARAPSIATGHGTTLYAPYFKNRWPNPSSSTDRSTGFVIMNLSASVVTVTGTFRCSSTNYTWDISNVYPSTTANFLHPTGVPSDCLGTAKFTTTTGGKSLAGMSSEAFLDPIPAAGYQSATAIPLVPESEGSTKVFLPVYKENYSGRTSGIYVRNMNAASSGNLTLTFYDSSSGSYYTVTGTLPADGLLNYGLLASLPDDKVYSVVATCTTPIIASVVEASYNSREGYCWGSYTCLDRVMYLGFK